MIFVEVAFIHGPFVKPPPAERLRSTNRCNWGSAWHTALSAGFVAAGLFGNKSILSRFKNPEDGDPL
jgi:hypothetical protein